MYWAASVALCKGREGGREGERERESMYKIMCFSVGWLWGCGLPRLALGEAGVFGPGEEKREGNASAGEPALHQPVRTPYCWVTACVCLSVYVWGGWGV